MTLRKGLPAKLALTDADDTRYDFSAIFVADTSGVPRAGVTSPVGVNLVTATGTMNVSVARFQGVAVRDAGVVLLANDGATNVLLDAAPVSNSRIDLVYAKQNDASSTVTAPDANNVAAFGVAKGTAAATPTKPAIPAGALELATVQIPSTATATNSSGVVITQTAQFTAAAGGVVPFRTKAEMDLWTTAGAGQMAGVIATGGVYGRVAGAWLLASSPKRSGVVAPVDVNYTVSAEASLTSVDNVATVQLNVLKNVGTFTSNTAVAQIPVGFRPAKQVDVPCAFANVTSGWARITTAGEVRIFFTGAASNQVFFNVPYEVAA